jgi:hypothetical protein
MNTRSKLLLRAILLTLLFAVQGLCHAHTVEHIMMGDNSPCTVCAAGGQLEDAAVSVTDTPSPGLTIFRYPVYRTSPVATVVRSQKYARGPPLFC